MVTAEFTRYIAETTMVFPKRRPASYVVRQKRRATLMALAIATGFVGAILYALSVARSSGPPTRLVNNVVCVPLSNSDGMLIGDQVGRLSSLIDHKISIKSLDFPNDSWTDHVKTGRRTKDGTFVAAWRHSIGPTKIEVYLIRSGSPMELKWSFPLTETAVVESLAVTDDGEYVATAFSDIGPGDIRIDSRDGTHAVLPDVPAERTGRPAWFMQDNELHLAVLYGNSGIVVFKRDGSVVANHEELATGIPNMFDVSDNKTFIFADYKFHPLPFSRIRTEFLVRLASTESEIDRPEVIFSLDDLSPQQVLAHAGGGAPCFIARCLESQTEAAIAIGVWHNEEWHCYVRRFPTLVLSMSDFEGRFAVVMDSDDGFYVRSFPQAFAELEALVSRGEFNRLKRTTGKIQYSDGRGHPIK